MSCVQLLNGAVGSGGKIKGTLYWEKNSNRKHDGENFRSEKNEGWTAGNSYLGNMS